jgi:hypothetical protein
VYPFICFRELFEILFRFEKAGLCDYDEEGILIFRLSFPIHHRNFFNQAIYTFELLIFGISWTDDYDFVFAFLGTESDTFFEWGGIGLEMKRSERLKLR